VPAGSIGLSGVSLNCGFLGTLRIIEFSSQFVKYVDGRRYNPPSHGGNQMRILLLSVVFLLISGSCVVAQDDWKADGSSLLKKCSLAVRIFDGEKLSSTDAVDGGICTGYLRGSHDTDFMVQMLEEHQKITLMKHACVPSNSSTEQIVRIVVTYLRDNPERLNMPGSVLVTDAIRSAFPCK